MIEKDNNKILSTKELKEMCENLTEQNKEYVLAVVNALVFAQQHPKQTA